MKVIFEKQNWEKFGAFSYLTNYVSTEAGLEKQIVVTLG
jgi:hypothetical protein